MTVGRRVLVHSYLAPRAGRYATSHLLELPDRLILVDLPLLAPHTAEILARVADLAKPLTEVFVTGDEPDHIAGTALVDQPVSSTGPIRARVGRYGRDAVQTAYRDARIGQPLIGPGPRVDREIHPGTRLFGDVPVTFSSVTVTAMVEHLVVELSDEGLLLTGDLVSNGVHPRLGGPELTGWAAALRQLRARTTAVVLPGHGRPGGPDLVEGMLRYLEVAQFVLSGDPGDEEAAARLRRTFPDHLAP